MTAAQFDDQLNFLRHCVASLRSAKNQEVANESRILIDQINTCKSMTLARKNADREARRENLIAFAIDTLSDRRLSA